MMMVMLMKTITEAMIPLPMALQRHQEKEGEVLPLGPPLRLGLETLGGGAPLALGGTPPPPLAAAPLGRLHLEGRRPPWGPI